ncbi:MAG: LysR family transcriptional regulator [Gammaproteobacteria bacterium]|nr:LysR family transcriptional regulator [Gammaproteobacteria bacterium]MDH3434729.1 LysR family transcriptional regulator [Gammaproteobacteria bacterium]
MRKNQHAAFGTNLRSLECFRTIIDQGSATAAAKHLKLTQPAVSRLLAVLEGAVGFPLFHRSKGRLIPTDEALTFYKQVDIALQSIDRVSDLARNLRNSDFGELTIVSPPSFAEGILSRVISTFIKQHANVRVNLDSESVEIARDMVALRAVDCGFIKLPTEHPGLVCKPLICSGTVCALPRGHHLASRQTIKVTDLAGEPLILLGKGRVSRQQIDDAFGNAGVDMNVRIETHTVGTACAFARDGSGIAIINEMLGLLYANRDIVFRRFSPDVKHEYAFMTSTDAPMTRVTQKFYEYCQDYFAANRESFLLTT